MVKKFNYHSEYPNNISTVAFLGHVINLSSRVQESTKDHTFHIICTKLVLEDAISVINDSYKESIEEYFTKLGRHKLRGMKKPVPLYGVKIHFAKNIEPYMLNYFERPKTENRKPKTGF